MTATVVLPRSLLELFPGTPRECNVAGQTVGEVIDDLDQLAPGLRNRLCDGSSLRPHLNVFVDRERASLSSVVPEGATVHVILAISGG